MEMSEPGPTAFKDGQPDEVSRETRVIFHSTEAAAAMAGFSARSGHRIIWNPTDATLTEEGPSRRRCLDPMDGTFVEEAAAMRTLLESRCGTRH